MTLQEYIKDNNVMLMAQHLFSVKCAIPGNPASYSFPLVTTINAIKTEMAVQLNYSIIFNEY